MVDRGWRRLLPSRREPKARGRYRWDDPMHAYSGVIYAPEIPYHQGLYGPDWTFSDYARPKFLRDNQGQVIFRANADYRRADPDDESAVDELKRIFDACSQVWQAAKPVAAVVNLADTDLLLSRELWTCAQLCSDLARLSAANHATTPAELALLAQLDQRHTELQALEREFHQLQQESSAEFADQTDMERQRPPDETIAQEGQPIHDARTHTAELRKAIREQNNNP